MIVPLYFCTFYVPCPFAKTSKNCWALPHLEQPLNKGIVYLDQLLVSLNKMYTNTSEIKLLI